MSAGCSLTLHFCHQAGSRTSVNQCQHMIGPEDQGGNSECLSGHFVLPVYHGRRGDSASSVYLQVYVANLNDPLCSAPTVFGKTCSTTAKQMQDYRVTTSLMLHNFIDESPRALS